MDYERWRRGHNEQRADSGERLAANWDAIRDALPGLTPAEIIAAAKGGVADLGTYCRDMAENRLAAEGNTAELVSTADTAALLGLTEFVVRGHARRRADFPNPVAKIGREWFLHLPDVRAYASGGREPSMAAGALDGALVGTKELAAELGLTKVALWGFADRKSADRVPLPDGRTPQCAYWLRENVERWKREHPRQP